MCRTRFNAPVKIKIVRVLVSLTAPVLFTACMAPVIIGGIAVPAYVSTPAMETAQQASDASNQGALKSKAEAGDRIAQYKLGESFCCHGGGPLDRISVYDNEVATAWYCKSAHQDYGPAQLRLAKIYSGHPLHGIRMVQRASALVGSSGSDMAVALMWASVAAAQGDKGSIQLRDDIKAQATPEQRAKAEALFADWHSAPCRWSEVFPVDRSGTSRP